MTGNLGCVNLYQQDIFRKNHAMANNKVCLILVNRINVLWAVSVIALILLLFVIIYILVITRRVRSFKQQYNSPEQVKKFNEEIHNSGFEYNPDKDIFQSLNTAWQRKYGYRRFYDDIASHFNMIFNCEPVKFDYQGRMWLIEFWKGQYGITTGAEIGLYVSDDGRNYKCVSNNEEIFMGFYLYKDNNIISRRFARHWWLTSFTLGEYSRPENLKMIIDIVFPNNEMCLSVINSLRKLGYNRKNMGVSGNSIRILFDRPYTKQPRSIKRLTGRYKMFMNKRYCHLYNKYTRNQLYTLDKIEYIRCRVPRLYKFCLKMLYIWGNING